ncbi:NAD(P)H-binding protein [Streptomyces phytohabitans]|uniref:NAD(P)H-binding protein n=1 Tax=Streptomyces phytohabitans TaxID=1150371 RepID=UPI00345C1AA7
MIGITGASGPLGRATTEFVLKTVDPSQVVLTTRRPEALADLAARGVQVRRADFEEPDTLGPAFEGVDRLLLISTDAVGARLAQQQDAIEAAVKAGVSHIVYTSVPEPVPGNPAAVVDDHAGTEQALRESGARWTSLRNNLYAHMQVATVEQAAASGRLVTNNGAGAAAYVTREDCAAAAAAVLTRGGYEDQALDITGPEAVTVQQLAALAKEFGGRDVEVVEVDDEAYTAGLTEHGLPEPVARVVASFGASIRGGHLAHVSGAVAELTGTAPTPLAEVVRAARTS